MELKVAVMIDGTFFLKRYRLIFGSGHDGAKVVRDLYAIVKKHVNKDYLLRIYYYDCYPFDKKIHTPIAKKLKDFSKTDEALFRKDFYQELSRSRKVALRLGHLQFRDRWLINHEKLKKLISNKMTLDDLDDSDFSLDLKQKGVDIKLGVDIATLAYKKLVDKIVLIAGDADYVPAIKLARIEGIDIVLDPMWNHIRPDLFEHIDGLQSFCKKPKGLTTKDS